MTKRSNDSYDTQNVHTELSEKCSSGFKYLVREKSRQFLEERKHSLTEYQKGGEDRGCDTVEAE